MLGNGSLNKKSLAKLKIPIPSLEKQKEIVSYLDFIYEKCNKTSNDKIDELNKLNEFCLNNQRVFGENKIKKLGEVCELQNGKRIVKDKVETGEYPVYGGGGLTSFYTNQYTREGKTCKISREGMSLHNCVLMLNEKYYLNSQALTIISKFDILLNEYLWHYLNNKKELVFECGRGTAQKAIDVDAFKNIKIPIPSLEKQKEIIEYCESNNNLIKQLENEIEQNKIQANLFLSSIVKKVGSVKVDDGNNDIDDEVESEYEIISYKNKNYILDNMELFEINDDESKGELFAKYKNGKVKKIQKVENEIEV
jgi:restriction endonuclease S subunit